MILDTIIEKKKETLEQSFQNQNLLYHPIAHQMKNKEDLFVIGEIKKASPSKGVIVKDFNVEKFTKEYTMAGVDALSILTEENFFQGSLENIKLAKAFSHIPVLRKDFIMDAREIIQSKQVGADMILLITAMLSDEQLRTFYQMANMLYLECIVEVHNEEELTRALKIHPEIIGINNRDLYTFEVSLETTKRLAQKIPDDICIVSESGIFTHDDMEFVKAAGVDAVLIGESFMRCDNFMEHLQQLRYGSY
ncbi:indole-3-glycerol phosphate synthase TrpC [Absiella sp. AM29-15]|uniref:indole-3-glycerol phosphate synthase TrpC n=1 Tax=Absiella sp. AM29-15 TaxID=2292278 RepID=UPI000E41D60F|nr:indole-3-glycerol phosphate synthase TrpC [Absiella sp. AM29-15]RGC53289.1 indole-3-glycerol phosphate synthase TrpC [Absiella sp. AM29-15]